MMHVVHILHFLLKSHYNPVGRRLSLTFPFHCWEMCLRRIDDHFLSRNPSYSQNRQKTLA